MSEASTRPDGDLDRRLAQVRLAVFDVDGTLTNGRVTYVGGDELQTFCVRDGYALARLVPAGIAHVWITGRGCEATERRAAELGVTRLVAEARDKAQSLAEVQGLRALPPLRLPRQKTDEDLGGDAIGRRAPHRGGGHDGL